MLWIISRADLMKQLSASFVIAVKCNSYHLDHRWIKYVIFLKVKQCWFKKISFFYRTQVWEFGMGSWSYLGKKLSPVHLAAITNTLWFSVEMKVNSDSYFFQKIISILWPYLLSLVANLFEPSVDGKACYIVLSHSDSANLYIVFSSAAVSAIKAQVQASNGVIKVRLLFHIFIYTCLRKNTHDINSPFS